MKITRIIQIRTFRKNLIDRTRKVILLATPGEYRQPQEKNREICNKFLAGNCTYGDKCHFSHEINSSKDISLIFSGALVDKEEGQNFGIASICEMDIPNSPDKFLVIGQTHSIKGMRLSMQGQMQPLMVLNFQPHETISCVRFVSGNLVYGIYFENSGYSEIRIMNLETKTLITKISPAHQSHIIGFELVGSFLLSISRDGKFKAWTFSQEAQQFVHATSISLEGTPSYFTTEFLFGNSYHFVGFEEGSLEIICFNEGSGFQFQRFSLVKPLHERAITSLFVYSDNVVTASLDKTLKIVSGQDTQTSPLNSPINFIGCVKNRNGVDFLAIAFQTGIIQLRKFSDSEVIWTQLKHQMPKNSCITCIKNYVFSVNDINFSLILVVDSNGHLSLWTFK